MPSRICCPDNHSTKGIPIHDAAISISDGQTLGVCKKCGKELQYRIDHTYANDPSGKQYSFVVAGLALEAIRLQPWGMNLAMVFHGFYCLLFGYLILRSAFMPRLLGALMAIAGLLWLTNLSTPLADFLFRYITVIGLLGEGLPMLWLLIFGVNTSDWETKAGAWRVGFGNSR